MKGSPSTVVAIWPICCRSLTFCCTFLSTLCTMDSGAVARDSSCPRLKLVAVSGCVPLLVMTGLCSRSSRSVL